MLVLPAYSAMLISSEAYAATGDVDFGAVITAPSRCTVIINSAGTLALSPDMMTLGSKEAGGTAGTAQVRTNRPHTVTAETLPFWQTAPSGGNSGVNFNVTWSGVAGNARGVTFSEQPGSTPITMPNGNGMGVTNLTVNMQAVRTGSIFPSGAYSKIVIIRCEE